MKRTNILCLQCSGTFRKPRAKIAVCPKCGWSIPSSEFEQLYTDAERVLTLGHRYREMYEAQVERAGKVTSMACLVEAPQWLVFATIAAMSGIIGNASYDAVKAMIKRLYADAPSKAKKERPAFATDDGIAIFVRHSRDFLEGMQVVDVTVRRAIQEEELAEIAGGLKARALRNVDMSDSEAVRKAISDSLRVATQKIKAGETSVMNRAQMQQLLSDVWNELPD